MHTQCLTTTEIFYYRFVYTTENKSNIGLSSVTRVLVLACIDTAVILLLPLHIPTGYGPRPCRIHVVRIQH